MRVVSTEHGFAVSLQPRASNNAWVAVAMGAVAVVLTLIAMFGGVSIGMLLLIASPAISGSLGPLLFLLGVLLSFGSIGATMIGLLALAFAPMVVVPMYSVEHVAVSQHGVTVTELPTRTLGADVETTRSGAAPKYAWAPMCREPLVLPFSQMEALGFTDHSLWFEMDAGRVEITLDQTRRADIRRLHGEIEAVWRRCRAGMKVSAEEARRDRARISAVVG